MPTFKLEGNVPHDLWEEQSKFNFNEEAMRVKRMDPWRLRQRHADILMGIVIEAGHHLSLSTINFIHKK
jgi:hypothetical protein